MLEIGELVRRKKDKKSTGYIVSITYNAVQTPVYFVDFFDHKVNDNPYLTGFFYEDMLEKVTESE